jgi:hypothetical protein
MVVVLFKQDRFIRVHGTIMVIGTADDSIYFRHQKRAVLCGKESDSSNVCLDLPDTIRHLSSIAA